MKLADTINLDMSRCLQQSSWQVRDKYICVALMEFSPYNARGKSATKSATKSADFVGHKSRKSATWFVSQTFMICVRDKVELCRKVGVMEFGLYHSALRVMFNVGLHVASRLLLAISWVANGSPPEARCLPCFDWIGNLFTLIILKECRVWRQPLAAMVSVNFDRWVFHTD